MSRRKAFTLVELLVVISIIALLLSILMPSLQMARKGAQSVVCRSNLKQWGYAFAMYENDYQGWLPQPLYFSSNPSMGAWYEKLAMGPYMPNATYSGAQGGREVIAGSAAVCVADRDFKKSGQTTALPRSYSFNYYIRHTKTLSLPAIAPYSKGEFTWKNAKDKSHRLVLADSAWDASGLGGGGLTHGVTPFYVMRTFEMEFYRHGGRGQRLSVYEASRTPSASNGRYSGKCNVLFGDWHVGDQPFIDGGSLDCKLTNIGIKNSTNGIYW